jgi:hypothetical protein
MLSRSKIFIFSTKPKMARNCSIKKKTEYDLNLIALFPLQKGRHPCVFNRSRRDRDDDSADSSNRST